ncbi:MAG: ergothioneine biosynthesis protein EgtB [Bacteroidetes bacterium]|jgi:ergothioneine biosynthesis protein EgtB|nr:ergothioneine biosynthesis protein EgtB [Bacteroidota bacterium]
MATQTKATFQNGIPTTLSKREQILKRFKEVRSFTMELAEPLETEDYIIQIVEHASPAKWHLAHTSWFFEAFFLEKAMKSYQTKHPQYGYLFNSYYLQTGEPHCRNKRGNLSRPTVKKVLDYRQHINEHVFEFLENCTDEQFEEWEPIIEVGLHHEQQHQELMLTDLKIMFSNNPLHPAYLEKSRPKALPQSDLNWHHFDEGIYEVGHPGGSFGYDNEFPRHKTYIHDFELADRLITNGEYINFMESGGYEDPKYWLDEGYAQVVENEWDSPLYWQKNSGQWHQFTLNGLEPVDMNEPVTHVNYYEADAYARWAGCRLPTEFEWELAAEPLEVDGSFVDARHFHPVGANPAKTGLKQMFGEVWQWTRSSYAAYPGYETFPGALGEYNGKFMCNQYVLRGGSCATSKNHFRKTYRNFFHTKFSWQFTGIRLAR